MRTPFFSVIIPSHNRRDGVQACLRCLDAQSLPPSEYEVIVVDDGSTDGTTRALEERRAAYALRVISIDQGGPGRARNVGAAAARGTFLAFTEDDITINPDWLATARMLLRQEDVDVLDGHTAHPGSAVSIRRGEDDSERHPAFIPCNLFVRREAFTAVGEYDPAFFDPQTKLYFREDADLGFRLLKAGYRVKVAPSLIVHHPEQFPTFRACLRHARRYSADGLLYRKHPALYRDLIEVKTVLGVRVRRPLHFAAVLYAASLGTAVVGTTRRQPVVALVSMSTATACMMLFRARYQGARAVRLWPLAETAQFARLPLTYLWALARGAWRFRAPGVFL